MFRSDRTSYLRSWYLISFSSSEIGYSPNIVEMSEDEVAVLEEKVELLKSDPAFKLFGRRIPVLLASSESTQGSSDTFEVTKNYHTSDDTKSSLFFDNMPLNKVSSLHTKSISNPNSNGCKESPENENKFNGKTLFQTSHEKSSTEREKLCDQKSNMNAEGNVVVAEGSEESNKKEDDMPKKPDKLLPCPRCESMDTKFCYYNNYNVNQPRHFCRNCQRYWTAGGLLRSVPVGAGRRKNKHSAVPHQRNLSHTNDCDSDKAIKFEVSDLEMTGGRQSLHDVKKGTTNHLGAYVGRETSSLFSHENENIQKSSSSSSRMKGETFWNTSCSSEWRSYEKRGELGTLDSFACASSSTNFVKSEMEYLESNNTPKDEGVGYELPNNSMSWVSGPPPVWSLYCGSLFGNSPYMNAMRAAVSNPETFQASVMMPWFQPETGPCSGFPWPFPSDPMCGQASWGAAWGMPLRPVVLSSKSSDSIPSMLGKHTRDMSASQPESKGDGSIWVPKTLKIDDPEEAAKSCIWAASGPGSKPESITSGGIFKAFQPKTEDKDNTKTPVRVLCANPAASARSASFNESN